MQRLFLAIIVLLAAAPVSKAADHHITVQPIQVRNDDGTPGPNPIADIAVAATNKIFAQADADVTFLSFAYLDSTAYLTLETTDEFRNLTFTPGHGQNPDPLVINMWLVQSSYPGDLALFRAWVGANGVAVNGNIINLLHVPAHCLAFNLGLSTISDGSEPNNLMIPVPLQPGSLANIYPDGLGRCYLNPTQIATTQASRFVQYVDLTPPTAPVLGLSDGDAWRQVTWQNPAAADFDHTCLYRGATPGFTDGEIVYCGGGTNYDEDHLLRWYYRARAFDTSGNASEWSNEVVGRYPTDVPGARITRLRLYPNQPNPFNPMTTIRFDLPAAGSVRLVVHDVAGRLVKVLAEREIPAGSHEVVWDGRDRSGRGAPSGAYFARLETNSAREITRMTLVR